VTADHPGIAEPTPLPAGYTLRPPAFDDLDRLAEMIVACDVEDVGAADFDAAILHDSWRRERFDLSRDAWLVVAPGSGEPVAYAEAWEREPHRYTGYGVVANAHRGRGLGVLLLELAERRAARGADPEGNAWADSFAPLDLVDATELLTRHGYGIVRHFWTMEVSLSGPRGPVVDPEGVSIRSFRRGEDERTVYQVWRESFAEHWGSVERPYPEWAAGAFEVPGFDPSLYLLAEADGRVVGITLAERFGADGHISTVGVLKPWRRRGIGAAMLERAFAEFRERGIERVTLGVDSENATGAVSVYERAGMHVFRRYALFRKEFVVGPNG
jgi:mycothiol synthase